jgi:hypothetical protein
VILRGGAISCLVEFLCEEKSYALLVSQPRIPIGKSDYVEVCAGMLDGSSDFVGVTAKEIEVYIKKIFPFFYILKRKSLV